MPFASVDQAYYLMLNHPDIFKRWKKKYGLPKGFAKRLGKASETRYPLGKGKVKESHEKVHTNCSAEDMGHYKRMHNRIVGAMVGYGMTHVAYNGNVLDETLPARYRKVSKWQ